MKGGVGVSEGAAAVGDWQGSVRKKKYERKRERREKKRETESGGESRRLNKERR